MKRRTVLSMEQALSLPYATLRFAQLGWRVIRIEKRQLISASTGPSCALFIRRSSAHSAW